MCGGQSGEFVCGYCDLIKGLISLMILRLFAFSLLASINGRQGRHFGRWCCQWWRTITTFAERSEPRQTTTPEPDSDSHYPWHSAWEVGTVVPRHTDHPVNTNTPLLRLHFCGPNKSPHILLFEHPVNPTIPLIRLPIYYDHFFVARTKAHTFSYLNTPLIQPSR